MRGVYGKARLRYVETQIGAGANATSAFVESSVDASPVTTELRRTTWEGAKVGVVLMLSAIAAVTAGKVLSPSWAKR
jgi:hypothetical protein